MHVCLGQSRITLCRLAARRAQASAADPDTGDVKRVPFARQSELVLKQLKLCLEAAGSSLERVLKCNVYCTPLDAHFDVFNEVYARYFSNDAPARIFLHVPSWPGPFDIEVDCVATL